MKDLSQNKPVYSSSAQRSVEQANARTRLAIERFRDAQITEFKKFWTQPRTDIEAQLLIRGNKAVAAFDLHAASVLFVLNAEVAYPAEDFTPPYAYTKHDDGTITLD